MIFIDANNVLQEIKKACARIGRPRSKPKSYKKYFDDYIPDWEAITDDKKQKIFDILAQIITFYELPQIKKFFRVRPRSKINFYTNYHCCCRKFCQHFLSLRKDGIYWVYEKETDMHLKLPLDFGDLTIFYKKKLNL